MAILGLACAGLLSGEALQITTTPSHTPTPTHADADATPTGGPSARPTPWLVGTTEIAVNGRRAAISGRRRSAAAPNSVSWPHGLRRVRTGTAPAFFARGFDRAGEPSGNEFAVNTVTTGDQDEPAIGSDRDGAFVIAWSSGSAGARDVRARRFDAGGNPIGAEFLVNTYSTGDQHSPVVGKDPRRFVVVWSSEGPGRRRYRRLWPEVQRERHSGRVGVSGQRDDDRRSADSPVSPSAPGNFVVVWESEGQDGDQGGIFGRLYDPRREQRIPVNDVAADDQTDPDVVILRRQRQLRRGLVESRTATVTAYSHRASTATRTPLRWSRSFA